MKRKIHGKTVLNLALYAALGCLLILLLSGASRERLLREKTSNPYSERAITVAFPDDGGETVKRLLADERLPEVELLYSDGQLLGCNGKALASERLHLLSGQILDEDASDAPGAMIGKGLQGDVDEENRIGVLRSRLPVTGVLGYEELYTQMDYRIVVPLSYLCEEMGYALPSLIVDGTAAEMERFRMLLAADYEKECSVQPVKEVGLREVYQIRKADNQVTLAGGAESGAGRGGVDDYVPAIHSDLGEGGFHIGARVRRKTNESVYAEKREKELWPRRSGGARAERPEP